MSISSLMRSPSRKGGAAAAALVAASLGLCLARPAAAQYRGFQINRFEPTAAGEWSFMVSHPWYSQTRYFAAGLSMNYAHDPLIFSQARPDGSLASSQAIIAHQLTGHLDLAGSAFDRVLFTASLPVALYESGTPAGGLAPADSPYVSDPRLGAMVRLWGQPYASPFSISVGGQVWIPLRAITERFPEHSSDQQVRGRLEVAMGGLARHVLWSATVAALLRPNAQLGALADPVGRTAGPELQVGAALAYACTVCRVAIGPEVLLATAMSGQFFKPYSTSLEVLLGVHHNIARLVEIGVAGGVGMLRQAGTPDGRVLFRIAYAPMAGSTARPRPTPPRPVPPPTPPAPLPPALTDRDADGIADPRDRCPDEPQGANPDPTQPGCPLRDKDGDGVLDIRDACPEQPQGEHPDPKRPGCPAGDKDSDGVLDPDDQCPDQPRGEHPDPARLGCPAGDKDSDGVFDPDDQCPDTPAGSLPDPDRRGCPAPDVDGDLVPDSSDACPNQPGVPDPDPKKNGCPTKLVEIRSGQVVIKQQIFFAFNKDLIMPVSTPVLEAVANTLANAPQIKKLRIEGHTDNTGNPAANLWLSNRRAEAVMRWLVEHGIDPMRLSAEGFGDTRPIGDNATLQGRVKNRRVDFVILE